MQKLEKTRKIRKSRSDKKNTQNVAQTTIFYEVYIGQKKLKEY